MDDSKVAIINRNYLDYSKIPPFNPNVKYPEYPFNNRHLNGENIVYDEIRKLFRLLELDKDNFNKENWNPLGDIIKPNDNVLIKPSFVSSFNDSEHLITNGSIIRFIIDYIYIALNGEGSITIGDAPIQIANWEHIIEISGITHIYKLYKKSHNFKINIVDFRNEKAIIKNGILKKVKNDGDPLGYSLIDLNINSDLHDISKDYNKFRVTNYDKNEMLKHHNTKKHEYFIANTVLNSDIIINIPKLKTHLKAGMTCAMKNLVGCIGSKNVLPHHRKGSIKEHGDEYLHSNYRKQRLSNLNEKMDIQMKKLNLEFYKLIYYLIYGSKFILPFDDNYFEGSWYGNDTISRTVTDINRIIHHIDKDKLLSDKPQRKQFIIVDGIKSGEKNGPLKCQPKHCGLLVAGYNPVAIDLVCSRIMGFDYNKINTFKHAMKNHKYDLFGKDINDLKILSENCEKFEDLDKYYNYSFIPPDTWLNHIEIN